MPKSIIIKHDYHSNEAQYYKTWDLMYFDFHNNRALRPINSNIEQYYQTWGGI